MFQYRRQSSLLSTGRKLMKLTPLKSQDNVAIILAADGQHLNFPLLGMACGTIPLTSAWIWIQLWTKVQSPTKTRDRKPSPPDVCFEITPISRYMSGNTSKLQVPHKFTPFMSIPIHNFSNSRIGKGNIWPEFFTNNYNDSMQNHLIIVDYYISGCVH